MFKINDTYHGFKLLEQCKINEINSIARVFEHTKSGAHLIHLENNDDNKVFSVSYRTTPINNCGIPHILEHSVLCGSKDYKIKSVFRDISQSSLKTFLNAITFPDNTTYPISSRNTTDFYNLMDLYLNATLYPNIYENKEILRQEGWRYEFKDNGEDLCYKGIVYSEMKGALSSPAGLMCHQIYASLFPNTPYEYDAGGIPEFIPDLTQEEFEDFHRKYYHPVNSYMYLYGDQDLLKCLEIIDDRYLSNFDRIDMPSKIEIVEPFDKMNEVYTEYAITADEDDRNRTALSLNFVGPEDSDPETYITMKILYNMLVESSASPIKKALFSAGVGDSFITYGDMCIDPVKQSYISIVVNNSNPEQKDKFKNIIMSTLNDLVKNGINKELLEASINSIEFALREADPEKVANKGIEYMWRTIHSWLYDASPLNHLAFENTLNKLKEAANNKYFENFIEKYMLNNTHSSLVVLTPKKGLAEIKVKEMEDRLKEYRDSLSKEELTNLKERNEKLRASQVRKLTDEEVATIPKVPLNQVSKKAEEVSQVINKIDDVGVLLHEQPTNKISYINFLFDLNFVDPELLPYVSLLSQCLGEVDTKENSYTDLNTKIYKYTGGISFETKVLSDKDNENLVYPKLVLKSKVISNNMNTLFDIIKELLTSTSFENKVRIKEIIQENKSILQKHITGDADLVAFNHSAANLSLVYKYREIMGGISYYNFLCELERNFDERSSEIQASLVKLFNEIINKNNLIISFTGDKEDFNTTKPLLNSLLDNFKNIKFKSKSIDFNKKPENEGVIISSSVQYVCKSLNYKDLGHAYSGKMRVLKTILQAQYLMSKVRLQGGAYGCALLLREDNILGAASYRDPNLTETIDVFNNCYEFLNNMSYSQEDMDNFKIGALGLLDFPRPCELKGEIATENYIRGISQEDLQNHRDELLSTTLEDLKAFAPMFKQGMEQNNCCVLGNESKVTSCKNSFEKIITVL